MDKWIAQQLEDVRDKEIAEQRKLEAENRNAKRLSALAKRYWESLMSTLDDFAKQWSSGTGTHVALIFHSLTEQHLKYGLDRIIIQFESATNRIYTKRIVQGSECPTLCYPLHEVQGECAVKYQNEGYLLPSELAQKIFSPVVCVGRGN